MKVEKLERISLNVRNLDEAISLFSNLFGIEFEKPPGDTIVRNITERADRRLDQTNLKPAISPIGLQLLETDPPAEKEGVRSIYFKVSDLDQAIAEMKEKGIHLLAEFKHGNLREAIFDPDGLHGARIILTEFRTATPIDAILQR